MFAYLSATLSVCAVTIDAVSDTLSVESFVCLLEHEAHAACRLRVSHARQIFMQVYKLCNK